MKRPIIGFTMAFALMSWLELRFSLWERIAQPLPVLLFLVIVTAAACEFERTVPAGIILCGLACGMLLPVVFTQQIVHPAGQLAGRTYSVHATVGGYAQIYDEQQRVALRLEPDELDLSGPWIHVLTVPTYVPLTEQPLQPGDRVQATLYFYSGSVMDGFARREYYASNGVFILARCAQDDAGQSLQFCVEPADKTPLWAWPQRMAQALKARISAALPAREAGLVCAIMLGDKSGMSSSEQLALRKAGLSHVTAVSGMHVGFLVGFFYLLFGRKYGSVLSICAILIFVPMAGGSPSVIRAGIMYLAGAVGFCIGREKDGLNTLFLALLILLVRNPYAIDSLSLQLSFSATLGLILFCNRLQHALMRPFQPLAAWLQKIIGFIIGSLACSLSAMAFTTPILLLCFGYVSALSIPANLLTVSVVGLLFIYGHLCGILLLLFPGAASICAVPLQLIASYLLLAAEKIAALPYGLIYKNDGYGIAALLFIYVALILILLPRPKIRMRYITLVLCVFLGTSTVLGVRQSQQTLTISCLPSGSGQTIAVSDGRGACTLIDCSASGTRDALENVQEYLAWHALERIDTVILTAVDKTHARSIPDLLHSVPVGRLVIPAALRETALSARIFAIAEQYEIPVIRWEQAGEQPLSGSSHISLIGNIPRKLAVRIQAPETDILVLHSLTQKMLESLLTQQQSLRAQTIVLSEGNLEDDTKLQAALDQISPQEIILQSGYNRTDRLQRRYPVRNTYLEGEITYQTRIPSAEPTK